MNGKKEVYQKPNVPTAEYLTQAYPANDANRSKKEEVIELPSGNFSYRLEDLAFTRSGDKGNNCNIGKQSNIQNIFTKRIINKQINTFKNEK